MALEIDLSSWPIAVVARDGETAEALDVALGGLLDRKERFGLVLDLGRQSRTEQAEFSGWLQTHKVRARRYVLGCALVVPEATVEPGRALIAAHPDAYPFPAWVASTRDECRSWVEGILATSGPLGIRPPRH